MFSLKQSQRPATYMTIAGSRDRGSILEISFYYEETGDQKSTDNVDGGNTWKKIFLGAGP